METTSVSSALRRVGESSFVRLMVLGFLVLVLLWPVSRVRELIYERMGRRAEVVEEITGAWGRSQTLTGPVWTVPVEVLRDAGSQRGEALGAPRDPLASAERPAAEVEGKRQAAAGWRFEPEVWEPVPVRILPAELSWRGRVEPQVRYRGLFEVVVYEARLEAGGTFVVPDLAGAGRRVLWDQAELALGIPDARGLQRRVQLRWGGEEMELLPGPGLAAFLCGGIHGGLSDWKDLPPGTEIPFSFELVLRGSDVLRFVPAGADIRVEIESTWASPSFVGGFLPSERRVGEDGFSAVWSVPYFGRGFPQQWWGDLADPQVLDASSFGVSLVLPADAYQQTERAVKYAVLFIVLTFGTFFLLEVVSPVRLHAVQYLLVGFALSLFYVLLLAFSEQLGFGLAYGLAATATVSLIAGYSRSILSSGRRALGVLGCLGLLYGYLYVLLRLEDYALLVGALGLFATLALVMVATRNLDWFTLRFLDAPRPEVERD